MNNEPECSSRYCISDHKIGLTSDRIGPSSTDRLMAAAHKSPILMAAIMQHKTCQVSMEDALAWAAIELVEYSERLMGELVKAARKSPHL